MTPTRLDDRVRRALRWAGAALVAAALTYPFESPPDPAARAHVFAVGALAAAAALFGFGRVRLGPFIAFFLFCAWVVLHGGPFAGAAASACAAGLLGLLAYHCGTWMRQGNALQPFLVAVVTAAFVNAVEGLLQYLGLGWHLYPWVVESMQRGVAYGVFKQRNVFAILLVVAVASAAWLHGKGLMSKAMAWSLCVVLQLAIAASGSRVAVVSLVAVALAGWWLLRGAPRSARWLLLLQPLILFAASWAVLGLAHLHGFAPQGDIATRLARAGSDSRLLLWSNALAVIEARPWWGWGWGQFGYGHYATVLDPRFGGGVQTLSHAHNLLLQVAAEGGLPLAMVLAAGATMLVVRVAREARSDPDRAFAALLLLPLALHSMVELPLWWPTHLFIAACALGVLLDRPAEPPAARSGKAVLACLAVLLAAASFEGARQYQAVARLYDFDFRAPPLRARALAEAQTAWLFRPYVEFAQLGEPLTRANAAEVRKRAQALIRFSAEPAVAVRLVQATWLLGQAEEATQEALRLRNAFPQRYAAWLAEVRTAQPELAAWLDNRVPAPQVQPAPR